MGLPLTGKLSDYFSMNGENNLHPSCLDLHHKEKTSDNASIGLKNLSRPWTERPRKNNYIEGVNKHEIIPK
jgi:hypothetical protein